MNRRSAIRRMLAAAAAAAASAIPLAQRTGYSAMRGVDGWLSVLGEHGRVIIRVSPRFALEHPRETLEILRTGTLR